MRALLQRVSEASVSVNGDVVGQIGSGLLVLVGVEEADTAADIDWLARKLINLRIFNDEQGVMNWSVLDVGGEVLAVSQFTLHASCKKGNRPSYSRAAKGDVSEPMYQQFCHSVQQLLGKPVAQGQFGADMKVSLINDGPVTIWLDSKQPE
ncbi:D-aminoacyl-tRNA deacylase [Chitinivorax sp. B]|uniref:D-aminoacyl-tRNA deacylase n=1 Tax=Chitinivorax sp. B TaxID=2502235 RepID=UPI0010F67FA2|nr:D-aminoacyl-tRNA deacylase [Chitinivorax sp. B]